MIYVHVNTGYTNPTILSEKLLKDQKFDKIEMIDKNDEFSPSFNYFYIKLISGFNSFVEAKIWIAKKRIEYLKHNLHIRRTMNTILSEEKENKLNVVKTLQGEIDKCSIFLDKMYKKYPEHLL